MNIGINAICINDRPSGAKQHFIGIYNELFKHLNNVEFIVYEPSDCRMHSWFEKPENVRLPYVLVETIASDCTPVSTDCPTGPKEVLQYGQYGHLVPTHDPQSMANAIKNAIENPITSEAIKEIVKPFTEEVVIHKHREVLGF